MSQITEYSVVVTVTQSAITADQGSKGKWEKAGPAVAAFYGTDIALWEVKAQFIADAILPAVDKRHAKALAVELPRKNSADYVALDQSGRDKWEAANEAKKLARATVDTYFKRVVSYAFPKEKEPSESKSLETKLADLINQAIGKCEKAEAPAFDVSAALTGLRAALAAVTK
jgi:viroplasmin and RNaseH domain-containing protein